MSPVIKGEEIKSVGFGLITVHKLRITMVSFNMELYVCTRINIELFTQVNSVVRMGNESFNFRVVAYFQNKIILKYLIFK